MEYQNKKFEFGETRLIFEAGEAAPSAAAAPEAPKPAEIDTAAAKAKEEAAAKKIAEEAAAKAEAKKRGDAESAEAGAQADKLPTLSEGEDATAEPAEEEKETPPEVISADAPGEKTSEDHQQEVLGNKDYHEAFSRYFAELHENPEKARKDLVEKIKDTDRDAANDILDQRASEEELKKLAEKFKKEKRSPDEIRAALGQNKLNAREATIALKELDENDIAKLLAEKKIKPEEAEFLRKQRQAPVSTEGMSNVEAAVATGGFFGFLDKMISWIESFAKKFAGWIEGIFKRFNPTFEKSPLGGNRKFEISRKFEQGRGVDIKTEKNENVAWVGNGAGKVLDVSTDSVTIAYGDKQIKYGNITSSLKKDDEVPAGETVGKTKDTSFNFQLFDTDGKEINPESRFREFAVAAKEAPAAPAFAVTHGPLQLPSSEKANVTKEFEELKSGIEISAAEGTKVQMVSDGIIRKSDENGVEVACANGIIIRYKGLKNDATRKAADPYEVAHAGESVGEIDDKKILAVEITENNQPIDPKTKLSFYLA